jgi:hypothetical protein
MADTTTTATAAHTIYDVLKDFQPAMAALIALGAATLAYRGAMANVALGKETSERQRVNDRRGLYLRLRSQLSRLAFASRTVQGHSSAVLEKNIADFNDDILLDWTASPFKLEGKFGEIEKAWDALQFMPSSSIPLLDKIRAALESINETIEASDKSGKIRKLDLILYTHTNKVLEETAVELVGVMSKAILGLEKFD